MEDWLAVSTEYQASITGEEGVLGLSALSPGSSGSGERSIPVVTVTEADSSDLPNGNFFQ